MGRREDRKEQEEPRRARGKGNNEREGRLRKLNKGIGGEAGRKKGKERRMTRERE